MIAEYHNTRWPYFAQMAKLCTGTWTTQFSEPQQGIATASQGSDVTVSDQLNQDTSESSSNNVFDNLPFQLLSENTMQDVSSVFLSQATCPSQPVSGNVTQNVSDMFPSQPVSEDVMQQGYDLDINHLLGLGQEITSPNPSIQMAVVHSAMLAISQMSHGSSLLTHQCSRSIMRVFGYALPPSTFLPDNPILICAQGCKKYTQSNTCWYSQHQIHLSHLLCL